MVMLSITKTAQPFSPSAKRDTPYVKRRFLRCKVSNSTARKTLVNVHVALKNHCFLRIVTNPAVGVPAAKGRFIAH